MLQSLHVKNIALIDDIEIEFTDGLNILTGETGAGKSIIIDSVNFALGSRMPKDIVRDDSDYAICEPPEISGRAGLPVQAYPLQGSERIG